MTGRVSDEQLAADLALAKGRAIRPHVPEVVAYLRELQEAREALRMAEFDRDANAHNCQQLLVANLQLTARIDELETTLGGGS